MYSLVLLSYQPVWKHCFIVIYFLFKIKNRISFHLLVTGSLDNGQMVFAERWDPGRGWAECAGDRKNRKGLLILLSNQMAFWEALDQNFLSRTVFLASPTGRGSLASVAPLLFLTLSSYFRCSPTSASALWLVQPALSPELPLVHCKMGKQEGLLGAAAIKEAL